MSFTIETKRMPEKLLPALEKIADITCEQQQAIICLVGEDIHGRPGIAANVFSTIADAGVNIRMISQGASEINISFVVKESDVPQAVRHLHAKFFGGDVSSENNSAIKAKNKVNGSAAHTSNGIRPKTKPQVSGKGRKSSVVTAN